MPVEERADPTALLDATMSALRAYAGGKLTDDIAMLAIRFEAGA